MTKSDLDCLAHVVIDPQAWYDHVIKTFGEARAEAMLAAKVERHWENYVQESAKPDYKSRLEREAIAAQALAEKITPSL